MVPVTVALLTVAGGLGVAGVIVVVGAEGAPAAWDSHGAADGVCDACAAGLLNRDVDGVKDVCCCMLGL